MRGGGFGGARFARVPGGARFAVIRGSGFRHGFHRHGFRRFAPFAVGLGWPYYNEYYYDGYYDNYPYDEGCYDLRRVPTRYGWRWQRVYVCS
jgi:hypothetical protein